MKISNILFLLIILILSGLSLIAIISIHYSLIKFRYQFSFSPEGINTYLNAYCEYKTLFTATITSVATYIAILRLKAASDANFDKLKQDRFNEWKIVLDILCKEIETADPIMTKEFIKLRYNYFRFLYNYDFNIQDETTLNQLFEMFFSKLVPCFEKNNTKYKKIKGIYRDPHFTYSFDNFYYLFDGCINQGYPALKNNLKELYTDLLPSDRTIDPEKYNLENESYIP